MLLHPQPSHDLEKEVAVAVANIPYLQVVAGNIVGLEDAGTVLV